MVKSVKIIAGIILVAVLAFSLVTTAPPPNAITPYLNGIFPESTPGASGTWEVEDAMPNAVIPSPLRILPFPGSNDLIILCKLGEVWRVSLEDQTQELILDIKEWAFKKGEAGVVGMALHPKFGDASAPDQQQIFIFYRYKPEPDVWDEKGFNRLSKFTWNNQTQSFEANSEEILFQQYDRCSWHNGGGMFFGPDGFLYLSVGDEGFEENQVASTQRLDGGLFSGVLRIDVDNNPDLSHPIRRQPIANVAIPAGWGNNFSQGYSIPNDNPWLSPDSSHLEEFYAIGIRSPYSMFYDSITQKIWLTDVGSNKREEINLVEKGDNLQWPYMEGHLPSEIHQKPQNLIGQEKEAYFDYDRATGYCIIGGAVYKGSVFPQLTEKYLFADYTQNKLMALTNTGSGLEPTFEILFSNLRGQSVELPEKPGITGIHPQKDGQILITVQDEEFSVPGKILRLKQKTLVPDPPSKLSELGVFADLETLTPIPGIIPYGVNAPLWSDRAAKKRWMAIPNDGDFSSADEQIVFENKKPWTFPEGSVFIKHFELPLSTEADAPTTRLETRFFIIGKNKEAYGLTYKWNDEGSDAILMGGGTSKDFDIQEGGQLAYTQTWEFPSRDQCMTCHTENAAYVLGVNTHQLNGDLYYPELGQSMNQLQYLNQLGVFQRDIGNAADYLQAHYIGDESADLGLRIRSYLDANCASCHKLGGLPMISMDLRYTLPLELQNFINQPTQSQNSHINNLIVQPGNYLDSELWIRSTRHEDGRMPPLGRSIVDEVYVDALAKWIGQLPPDAGSIHQFTLFPNPGNGWLNVRINDDWQAPFQVNVYNGSGKRLYFQKVEGHSMALDLTDQAAGIYLLEIIGKEQRQVKKFILH